MKMKISKKNTAVKICMKKGYKLVRTDETNS